MFPPGGRVIADRHFFDQAGSCGPPTVTGRRAVVQQRTSQSTLSPIRCAAAPPCSTGMTIWQTGARRGSHEERERFVAKVALRTAAAASQGDAVAIDVVVGAAATLGGADGIANHAEVTRRARRTSSEPSGIRCLAQLRQHPADCGAQIVTSQSTFLCHREDERECARIARPAERIIDEAPGSPTNLSCSNADGSSMSAFRIRYRPKECRGAAAGLGQDQYPWITRATKPAA